MKTCLGSNRVIERSPLVRQFLRANSRTTGRRGRPRRKRPTKQYRDFSAERMSCIGLDHPSEITSYSMQFCLSLICVHTASPGTCTTPIYGSKKREPCSRRQDRAKAFLKGWPNRLFLVKPAGYWIKGYNGWGLAIRGIFPMRFSVVRLTIGSGRAIWARSGLKEKVGKVFSESPSTGSQSLRDPVL
jgi:hypothetical protein